MGKCFKSRVGIQIVSNRPDNLAILLTSLKFQTFKKWDVVLVIQDQAMLDYYNLRAMILRLEYEGHRVKVINAKPEYGIGQLRNFALEHDDCEYGIRIDDDSLAEPDYLEKLFEVCKKEQTIVGGITPFIHKAEYYKMPKRFNTFKMGKNAFELIDHSIFFYHEADGAYEVDHIRSSFMYPNAKAREIKFPTYNDDIAGFREETDFCLRFKKKFGKILFVPKAVCWHFLAPSGGTRPHWEKHGQAGKNEADRRFVEEMKKLFINVPNVTDFSKDSGNVKNVE